MSIERNNKKGLFPHIFRGSPSPSSSNLASQPAASPSLEHVQQDKRSFLSRTFTRKKQNTSSQTDLISAQAVLHDNIESSLNPSIAPSQRSFLDLQSVPVVDDQVSLSVVHHEGIVQDSAMNDPSANPEQATSAVEHDLHDTSAQSVPTILIDDSAAESSLDPSSAVSRIEIAAPPVLTPLPAPHDVHNTTIQPFNPAAADRTTGSQAVPAKKSSAKENLKVAGRFLQTIITKIPETVDSNPVKMGFGIAKVIIDIKNSVEGNMDAVEQKIGLIAEQLNVLDSTLGRWEPKTNEDKVSLKRLNDVFEREMKNLVQLKTESILKKIVDYENEKSQIADIFERVNEARILFGLATDLRTFRALHTIEALHQRTLLKDLEPSKLAHHKTHFEGEKKVLRRALCTPGTRERMLNNIVSWAKGTSSETIYWLFGRAGTGKTTISYTIARRFEYAASESQDTICLGGSFFSSRQFEETRLASHIIRTIVYHLALRCKPFADALTNTADFDTVNQNARAQLDGLLIGPWQESEAARLAESSPQYLIVIDALDEIEGTGGSDFLHDLLDTINKKHLDGLKFFVTSRPDPTLVDHVETFTDKQLYRLEEVPLEEADADIKAYLQANLANPEQKYIEAVATSAAGLFIYASTIVRYIAKYTPTEQNKILEKFFGISGTQKMSVDATSPLDNLYQQIVEEAFEGFEEEFLQYRLDALFTLVCASERVSTATVTQLLSGKNLDFAGEIRGSLDTSVADNVLERLHPVLYMENDKVLWHHKSFPDFLFDQRRSKEFWCDQSKHHQLLLDACFTVMKKGLQFNIAGIESSFVFDRDNSVLADRISKSISPTLSYACQKWNTHISFIKFTEHGMISFCGTLLEFLQLKALFWIEAMNLLKMAGQCGPMLRQAFLYVKKNNPELAQQLLESANFATYFSGSPTTLSTPHLYLSSLSTWPRDLEPCSKWKNFFPEIPAFRSRSHSGVSLFVMEANHTVNSVAFSPNGAYIVSGSGDELVQVWNASTGHQISVLQGHTEFVSAVAFSPDGIHIVSGSDDKSVRVWNMSSGHEITVLQGHTRSIRAVGFSPDSTNIVSGSNDRSIRVWDVSTGHQINMLLGHTNNVNSVVFSFDGIHIASGSSDNSVRVWSASTGHQVNVLQGHLDNVNSVAFSPDSTYIVSGSDDKSVRLWNTSNGDQISMLQGHVRWVRSVAFSPDGQYIVSGSRDRSIRVWDVFTGNQINILLGHKAWVNSVAFSPDGTHIVSGSQDRSIHVWSASIAQLTNQDIFQTHTSWVKSVAFSPDGAHIVSGSNDESVRLWDASNGQQINKLLGHTSWISSVAFSPDGTHIVSGSDDMSVRLWDVSTGQQINIFLGHQNWVSSVAFSPDGTHIISGAYNDVMRMWDASTGCEINMLIGDTNQVASVVFSPDSTHIVSGSFDGSVYIWDTSTCQQISTLKGHTQSVNSVAFSSDSTHIASGSHDNSVRVWNASTGQQIHILQGHTGGVRSVGFSPDGTQIVSGAGDKSVRVWNVSTGCQINMFSGHTDHVISVAFSSDGKYIVSGSHDNSIRVWNAMITQPQYMLEQIQHPHDIVKEIFTGWLLSPDGQNHLMFVPLDAFLPDDYNILTIPQSASSSVDLTNALLGPQWSKCYRQ